MNRRLASLKSGRSCKYVVNKKGSKSMADLIRILVAIILPPLGVFLQVGFGKDF